jgi:DNA processing protein
MKVNKITPSDIAYPAVLQQLHQPPQQLYWLGNIDLLAKASLAVVGSRKISSYGRAITHQLSAKVASRGIVIVSGLALGVDSVAHRAALEVKGNTIAVLPAGLDTIYPASHTQLARHILESNGLLISEYPLKTLPQKHHFIARNRLIAAFSRAILVTEAAERSGSLHTAHFGLELGLQVLAVPGNIDQPNSRGVNNLIKHGAATVTEPEDILFALGLQTTGATNELPLASTKEESCLLQLLHSGLQDTNELLQKSQLSQREFNQALTMLEINGYIRSIGNGKWIIT